VIDTDGISFQRLVDQVVHCLQPAAT
jgi:hypothetical protein